MLPLFLALLAPAAEPEYLGRKLSAWAEQLKSDPAPRKRRAAAVALGQMAQEGRDARALALPPLGRAIRSDNQAAVREQAVGAVAALPAEDAAPLLDDLTEALRGESEAKIRRDLAGIVGRFGATARPAVGPLAKMLADADATVRAAGAEALGRVGAPGGAATPELLALLGDAAPAARQAAAFALGRVEPPDPAAVAAGLRKLAAGPGESAARREAVESLRLLQRDDAETVELFAKLLGDAEAPVRERAVAALGALGKAGRPADAALSALVKGEKDKEVRLQAARALGRFWAGDTSELLARLGPVLAGDRDWEVRVAAAEELGGLGAAGKGALPRLQAARRDPQIQVREAAAEAIRQIESPTPPKGAKPGK